MALAAVFWAAGAVCVLPAAIALGGAGGATLGAVVGAAIALGGGFGSGGATCRWLALPRALPPRSAIGAPTASSMRVAVASSSSRISCSRAAASAVREASHHGSHWLSSPAFIASRTITSCSAGTAPR